MWYQLPVWLYIIVINEEQIWDVLVHDDDDGDGGGDDHLDDLPPWNFVLIDVVFFLFHICKMLSDVEEWAPFLLKREINIYITNKQKIM